MISAYDRTTRIEAGEMDEGIELEGRSARGPRPSLLVIGVSILTLIFVTQILQLFPLIKNLSIAKFTVLLAALSFLSSRDQIVSRVRVMQVPQLKWMLMMLALAVATLPFSFWPSDSLSYILNIYSRNIVCLYLIAQAVRDDRSARAIGGALVFGCAAIVGAMLLNFGPLVTYEFEPGRISIGGSYDPNDLALLFIVALPYAFFMLKGSRPLVQVMLVSSIGLMLVGIVKTGSRGGFIGLLVVGGLILMRGSRRMRKYTLLAAVTGIVLFAVVAPASYWSRIGTIYNYEQDYNYTMKEKNSRFGIWSTGLRIFAAHPLTGVGISCFGVAHMKYSDTGMDISPHNSFIQVATELGVIGLALFATIIFVSIRTARRVRRRLTGDGEDDELFWFASAVEISFIGFVVSGFFLTHAYSPIFCFVTGMSAALYARDRMIRAQDDGREEIEYA
ncbi:MAG TPA: O-antigen ligase family protein [Blastocatellia bacterium]|jgi:O-antigen ligase|nr:O-antigen ligase family protein [Blastocatellia bacterium]